jgi:hypothetical protein
MSDGQKPDSNSTQEKKPSDSVAIHRAAGEIYGRLREQLGFGVLSMRADAGQFVFQWRFNANGKQYQSECAILDFELLDEYCLHNIPNVANAWKNEHRKIEGKTDGTLGFTEPKGKR